MVRGAADGEGIQGKLFDSSCEVGDESRFEVRRDQIAPLFGAEDHVDELGAVGVRHGA
jgi:hypothetical protein